MTRRRQRHDVTATEGEHQPKLKRHRLAYQQGRRAALDGDGLWACPFRPGSPQRFWWRHGHDKATEAVHRMQDLARQIRAEHGDRLEFTVFQFKLRSRTPCNDAEMKRAWQAYVELPADSGVTQ